MESNVFLKRPLERPPALNPGVIILQSNEARRN